MVESDSEDASEAGRFHLDRSVLFMKRLEDSGKVVHMNVKDREMIQIFDNIAEEDGVAEPNDDSDSVAEVVDVKPVEPKLKYYYRRLAQNKAIINQSSVSTFN